MTTAPTLGVGQRGKGSFCSGGLSRLSRPACFVLSKHRIHAFRFVYTDQCESEIGAHVSLGTAGAARAGPRLALPSAQSLTRTGLQRQEIWVNDPSLTSRTTGSRPRCTHCSQAAEMERGGVEALACVQTPCTLSSLTRGKKPHGGRWCWWGQHKPRKSRAASLRLVPCCVCLETSLLPSAQLPEG